MEILNIFNEIADSNLAYYLLVVILIIVVIAMVYLIFTQNKEIKAAQKKNAETDVLEEANIDPVEEIAAETYELPREAEENIDRTAKIPIHDSVLQMVDDEQVSNEIPYQYDDIHPFEEHIEEENELADIQQEEPKEEKEKEPIITIDLSKEQDNHQGEIVEPLEEKTIEKVEEVEEVEITPEKKEELLDATMTNIPRVPLLEETMTSIPPIMDYLDNTQDLIDLTKELELAPKEKTIELTPFEEEQEQNAIISYDELFDNDNKIQYNEEEVKDDVTIKKVDLEETKPEPKDNYEHEENFLARLKSIQGRN